MSRSVGPNGHSCARELTPDELSARRIWNELERHLEPEIPCAPHFDYEGYDRIIKGRGTICIPFATAGQIPTQQDLRCGYAPADVTTASGPSSPVTNLAIQDSRYEDLGFSQGLNYELIPAEEIQRLWNQVVQDSSNRIVQASIKDAQRDQDEALDKLERLLTMALNSGNIDLAMLLLSGLETKKINAIAGKLMGNIRDLQRQRQDYINQLPAPKGASDASGTSSTEEANDGKKANTLNQQITSIGTEIQLLQTFLQDVMGQKNETQQMASNYIKSKHETAMGIVRNIA